MADPSDSLRRVVILGGAGAVGSMYAQLLLAAGAQVCLVDQQPPAADLLARGARFVLGDVIAPGTEVVDELRRADAVFWALPEAVAIRAAGRLLDLVPAGGLLVETSSVKGPIADVIRQAARPISAVGVNPMFAPSLGPAGRPTAVVVISDGDRVEPLMRVLGVGGGRLVQLELADHDRICAALQVLTHATVLAFGLALTRLDVDAAEINALAPPPHATLLAVLARILSGKPAVYWEIQAESEHGERAREALGQALNELAALVGDGDAGGFGRRLEELSAWFGEDLEPRREMCARMFGLTAGQKPGPKEMG